MPDLNIRGVDVTLVTRLKVEAASSGKTLREYCISLLGGEIVNRYVIADSGLDVRTETRSNRGRTTDKPSVPDVRKAKESKVGLHSVHAMRDELAGGGGLEQGREAQPGAVLDKCTKPGHKVFRNGIKWVCITCESK